MTDQPAPRMIKFTGREAVALYSGAVCIASLWLFWPLFNWLATTWRMQYRDTFGYVAPLISLWAVARERKKFLLEPAGHSSWGWAYFLSGVGMALFSRHTGEALGACLALPFYFYGLSLLVWGKARSAILFFPIFICLFLYPWDTLIESLIGFHLRLLSSWLAFGGLKMLGLGASISGTVIDTGRFTIDVAPACSGLTLLKVLFFMGAVSAYLFQGNRKCKGLLWVSTVPLAVLLNMFRILLVGLIGHFFGAELAITFFHQVSGLLIFGLALLVLFGEAALLKRAKWR